jgi:hypothetical protein
VNRCRKVFLTMILAISIATFCGLAAASDIYFASTASGSNNGTSCANAYAWNDGSNGWNKSGQQQPGNVLHICGTINFPANATALNTVNSGTNGNPITLKWEAGAILQAPYFNTGGNAAGAIQIGNSYWTLDGGTNGIIQNSLNGDPGATCPGGACTNEQGTSQLIVIAGSSSNVIVQNLHAGPAFVRQMNAKDQGIDNTQVVSIIGSNVHVTNNSLTGGYQMIALGVQNQSNIEVDHNDVTNCAHCTSIGYAGTGTTATNIRFHDNHFAGNNALYDDVEGNTNYYHVNAFIIFLDSGACTNCSINQLQIYNNLCDGLWSKLGQLNSCIFMDEQGSNRIDGYAIYNNVDNIQDGNFQGPSGAELISESQTSGNSNSFIMNNTVYQSTADGTCMHVNYPTSLTLKNNIFFNCGYQYLNNDSQSNPIYDNNTWYSTIGSGSGWIISGQHCTGSGCSFPQWQNMGLDTHGQFANPNLNTTTFALPSGSVAIGSAANLTSQCGSFPALCQGAPQTFGYNASCGSGCLPRPSSGAWDAGAYPYASGDPPPNPPSGLTAVVN